MLYIEEFHRDEEISFTEARRIIMGGRKDVDLLEAMKQMETRLLAERDNACLEDLMFEYYYDWSYEINAYNKIFSDMSKLFAPKAA